MAKYSAQLKAKNNQNANVTTTLSNVNPETNPTTIKQFAQMLNNLTTNTYSQTDYIVTTNLDTETPPVDTRQTPTITFPGTQPPSTSADFSKTITANYSGDGYFYVRPKTGFLNVAIIFQGQNLGTGQAAFMFKPESSLGQPTGGTYVVGADGTDNYKPIEIEYTLTL